MDTTQLETRIARLETSARRWRVVAIGLGCLMGGMVIAGAGNSRLAPSEVRVVNWAEMVGDEGAFNADGTLRTRSGKTAIATVVQGGTLDSVARVTKVEGEVTTTGRNIPGLPSR